MFADSEQTKKLKESLIDNIFDVNLDEKEIQVASGAKI
jgi:hypothetical protein